MITGDDVQVVTFKVGRQEFAFDILQVERILRYTAPSPLPKAPRFLEGVLPYSGGSVPVIDLRKRFELDAPIGEETRLMILELESHRVAVLVDAEVIFSECLLEPVGFLRLEALGHCGLVIECDHLWYGSPRTIVPAR